MTVPVVLVMGATATGKTTVGEALARSLGWTFLDGDALHPPANVAKMSAGTPLTDADRAPWLDRVADTIAAWQRSGTSGVITCSALKRAYRDRLRRPGLLMVETWALPDVLRARMTHRPGHFMPPALLASQLATLEPPSPDEHIPCIDTTQPVAASVAAIRAALDKSREEHPITLP